MSLDDEVNDTSSSHSREMQQVLRQAGDIAAQTNQSLSSAHILLALFTVPNLGELLLLEQRVNEETLLSRIETLEEEPPNTVLRLTTLAVELAHGCDRTKADCLHLLAAVTQLSDSFAHCLLVRVGVSIERLRATALRYATHGVPQRLLHMGRALEMDANAVEQAVRDTIESPALPRNFRPLDRAIPGVEVEGERTITLETEAERRSGVPGRRQSDFANTDKDDRRRAPWTADSPFSLDPERFKWLTELGRNLSDLAWSGALDPVIERDPEIEQAIDVLNKRRSNNPCLVGEPGVGKTAVAEGIAARLIEGYQEGQPVERILVQLDVGAILAGTHLRGALAQRLRGLQEEVRGANGRVVIFIDEIHTLIGSGGGDGAHDAANELKSALARGEFPCIGATTLDEYRAHIEGDPALERRFTAVHVEEPDEATTHAIVCGVADRYAQHHRVEYLETAFEAAVRMGRRYIHDRRDPDKALGILDLAGAVARRAGGAVDRRAVAEVVARMSRVPVDHLLLDDPQRFLEMEQHLARRLVGQEHVLTAIAETLRRNIAGFAGGRPIGSFLFLGPTGVGKTEAVKALAKFMFGSGEALTRFDMSEYLEQHSVARLIGAPPGYVGYGEGGQLTDAVRRRPYQVVLFDEIEKSHRDVWNLLLQVLDEGRLTDSRGRTVDFSNTVVVLTSNLGADVLSAGGKRIGFADASVDPAGIGQRVEAKARRAFPPELWNRIESRLVFYPLNVEQIRAIAKLLISERSTLLNRERHIEFSVTNATIDHLIENGGYVAELGARPMRQTISRILESPLAAKILSGEIRAGHQVVIDCIAGVLRFRVRTRRSR